MLCLKHTRWLKKRKLITISAAWELLDAVLAARTSIVHQKWNSVWTCFSGSFSRMNMPCTSQTSSDCGSFQLPARLLLASVLSGYNSATGNTGLLLSWRSQRKCNKSFAFSNISSLSWWPDMALKPDFLKLFPSWEQQNWKKKRRSKSSKKDNREKQ